MKETAAKKTGYTMDWITLTIPFGAIVLMCIAFFLAPEQSKHVLDGIRFFLGDTFGSWYLLVGFGGFLLSLYMAFSYYGKIRLGAPG